MFLLLVLFSFRMISYFEFLFLCISEMKVEQCQQFEKMLALALHSLHWCVFVGPF